MSKVIEINKCQDCPNFIWEMGTGFPYCRKLQLAINGVKLQDDTPIPDACPLESGEDYAERTFDIDRDFDEEERIEKFKKKNDIVNPDNFI